MDAGVAALHSSKTAEHYSPRNIVEAARHTLGGIDLDPASCSKANETVIAKHFYSKTANGLVMPWFGNVFLNPPGGKVAGKSSQKLWWQKLVAEWEFGEVRNAIFVCFSVELLQTSQVDAKGPLPLEFPICFPSRRVSYTTESGVKGSSPPHSSCIVLVAQKTDVVYRFIAAFGPMGYVKV